MYFAGIFFPLDNLGALGDVFERLPLSVHVDIFRAATSPDVSATGASVLAVAYSFLALSVAAWAFRRRIGHG